MTHSSHSSFKDFFFALKKLLGGQREKQIVEIPGDLVFGGSQVKDMTWEELLELHTALGSSRLGVKPLKPWGDGRGAFYKKVDSKKPHKVIGNKAVPCVPNEKGLAFVVKVSLTDIKKAAIQAGVNLDATPVQEDPSDLPLFSGTPTALKAVAKPEREETKPEPKPEPKPEKVKEKVEVRKPKKKILQGKDLQDSLAKEAKVWESLADDHPNKDLQYGFAKRARRGFSKRLPKKLEAKANATVEAILENTSKLVTLKNGKVRWRPSKEMKNALRTAGFYVSNKGVIQVANEDGTWRSIEGLPMLTALVKSSFLETLFAPYRTFSLDERIVRGVKAQAKNEGRVEPEPDRIAAIEQYFRDYGRSPRGFLSGNLEWHGPALFAYLFGEDPSRVHASIKSLFAQAAYRTGSKKIRTFVCDLSDPESLKKLHLKNKVLKGSFEEFKRNFGFAKNIKNDDGEVDGMSLCGKGALCVPDVTERFQFRALPLIERKDALKLIGINQQFRENLNIGGDVDSYNKAVEIAYESYEKAFQDKDKGVRFLKGMLALNPQIVDDVILFDINAMKGQFKSLIKEEVKKNGFYVTSELLVGMMQDFGDGNMGLSDQFASYLNAILPKDFPVEERRNKWAFEKAQTRFHDFVMKMISEFSAGKLTSNSLEALSDVLKSDDPSQKERVYRMLWNHPSVRYEFSNFIQNFMRRNKFAFISEGMEKAGLWKPLKEYVLDMNDLPSCHEASEVVLHDGRKVKCYEGILSAPEFWDRLGCDEYLFTVFEHPISDSRIIALVRLRSPKTVGKILCPGLYLHSSVAKIVLTGDTDGDMGGLFPMNVLHSEGHGLQLDYSKEDYALLYASQTLKTEGLWDGIVKNVEDYIGGADSVKGLPFFWRAEHNNYLSEKMVGSAALLQTLVIRLHDAALCGELTFKADIQEAIVLQLFPAIRKEIAALMELAINVMKKDISKLLPQALDSISESINNPGLEELFLSLVAQDRIDGQLVPRDNWSSRVTRFIATNLCPTQFTPRDNEIILAKEHMLINGRPLRMAESVFGGASQSRLVDQAKVDDKEFRIGSRSLEDFGVLPKSGLRDGIAAFNVFHSKAVTERIKPALDKVMAWKAGFCVANRIVQSEKWAGAVPKVAKFEDPEKKDKLYRLWRKNLEVGLLSGNFAKPDFFSWNEGKKAEKEEKSLYYAVKGLPFAYDFGAPRAVRFYFRSLLINLVRSWRANKMQLDYSFLKDLVEDPSIFGLFRDFYLQLKDLRKANLVKVNKELMKIAEKIVVALEKEAGGDSLFAMIEGKKEMIASAISVSIGETNKGYRIIKTSNSSDIGLLVFVIGGILDKIKSGGRKPELSEQLIMEILKIKKDEFFVEMKDFHRSLVKEMRNDFEVDLSPREKLALWKAANDPAARKELFKSSLLGSKLEKTALEKAYDSFLGAIAKDQMERKSWALSSVQGYTAINELGEKEVVKAIPVFLIAPPKGRRSTNYIVEPCGWMPPATGKGAKGRIEDSIALIFDEDESEVVGFFLDPVFGRIACGFDYMAAKLPPGSRGQSSKMFSDEIILAAEAKTCFLSGQEVNKYMLHVVFRNETGKGEDEEAKVDFEIKKLFEELEELEEEDLEEFDEEDNSYEENEDIPPCPVDEDYEAYSMDEYASTFDVAGLPDAEGTAQEEEIVEEYEEEEEEPPIYTFETLSKLKPEGMSDEEWSKIKASLWKECKKAGKGKRAYARKILVRCGINGVDLKRWFDALFGDDPKDPTPSPSSPSSPPSTPTAPAPSSPTPQGSVEEAQRQEPKVKSPLDDLKEMKPEGMDAKEWGVMKKIMWKMAKGDRKAYAEAILEACGVDLASQRARSILSAFSSEKGGDDK